MHPISHAAPRTLDVENDVRRRSTPAVSIAPLVSSNTSNPSSQSRVSSPKDAG